MYLTILREKHIKLLCMKEEKVMKEYMLPYEHSLHHPDGNAEKAR